MSTVEPKNHTSVGEQNAALKVRLGGPEIKETHLSSQFAQAEENARRRQPHWLGKHLVGQASALNGGLGLKSNEIVLRSLRLVAHKKPVETAPTQPLFESSEKQPVALSAQVEKPASLSQPLLNFKKNEPLSQISLTQTQVQIEEAQQWVQAVAQNTLPSPAPRIDGRVAGSQTQQVAKIGSSLAFAAALVDTLFALSVAVAGFIVSQAFANNLNASVPQLLTKLSLAQYQQVYFTYALAIHVCIFSFFVTFFVQSFSILFLNATVGRAFLGLKFSGKSGIFRAALVGFLEAATFGGAALIWLYLLGSSRYILAPWISVLPVSQPRATR